MGGIVPEAVAKLDVLPFVDSDENRADLLA
jgi:hypothetical protein